MQPESTMPPQAPPQGNDQRGFYRPSQPGEYNQTEMNHPEPAQTAPISISWEASEYIHHSKNILWTVVFVLIFLVAVALAIWLGAWTFAALIIVMGVAMGYFAFRPPRVLRYVLTAQSVQIDDKIYSLSDYRAFGLMAEGAFYSILLIPTERFKPALTLFFAQQDGEKIVDLLGAELPMESIKPDFIDQFMRRIRF